MAYTLSDFDYPLDKSRIAVHPVHPRDAAKLLVWPALATSVEGAAAAAQHATIADLPQFLTAGDVVVVNTSKVIPARLFAKKAGHAKPFEVLLHKMLGANAQTWEAFVRNSRKLNPGETLQLEGGSTLTVHTKRSDGLVELAFNMPATQVFEYLEKYGHMPLPPYIERADEAADQTDYQCVYADAAKPGSVAAPTAGLHLTPQVLAALEAKGVQVLPVTLHVGAGTFQPVKTEDLTDHTMHTEWAELPAATAAAISAAKAAGKRVLCVGTTSLRTVESAAKACGSIDKLTAWQGDTDLFLHPDSADQPQVADMLLTNYHLPKSTLLMLVAAFIGFHNMHALYRCALANGYRFFSYGDACLLSRK